MHNAQSSAETPRRGLVWVVEDSRLECQRTCGLIESAYQVEPFFEGAAMLEQISGPTRPDLVLLDWLLPGVSGLEACRFLRERFDEVSLPILMLTARGSKEDFTEGLLAGANDYVAKPYDDAELLARVRSLMRTRQQAEAMRVREALFATTLSSIADAVITTDGAERVTFLNRIAEALTQWTNAEALGRRIDEVFVVVDERTRGAGENSLGLASQEGKELDSVLPMTLRTRGGSEVPIEGSAASIGDGATLGRVLVFREVAARRKAERAAKERAQFEEKLIGIVSHDLRNPLNVVNLSASLMLSRKLLDETDTKAAQLIRSSGQRATRLVSDLLDFTRARLRPGLPATRQVADLHLIGEEVLEEMRVTSSSERLRLEASGDGAGHWDPDRIVQLMTNLLSNALKYGLPGGEVLMRTTGEEDAVCIEVHNEGAPIAPELVPVMFEPMERGGLTHTENGSVGLGLYIAQDIVRSHGGTIEVTSSAEEGTTFSVRLPRNL